MKPNSSASVKDWSLRRVALATIAVATVALGFYLLYRFYVVLLLLFVAIVFGTAMKPAVVWLSQRGVPRLYGELLIYVVLLALVIGFLAFTLPLIIEQTSAVSGQLTTYYSDFRWFMLTSRSQLLQRLGIRLPTQFQVQDVVPSPDTAEGAPAQDDVAQAADRVARAFQVAGLAAGVAFAFVAVFIMAFYWTLEGDRVMRAMTLLVPRPRRDAVRDTWATIESKVGGFLLGQAALCVTIGVLQLVAYTLIGLPNALILAVIAGVTEAIPIVGPALGAVPAVLMALSRQPDKVIWVLASTAVIQGLENSVLVPRIMGRSVGVNPLLTLLSLAALSSLWGIPGALLAIPIAATLQLLADRLLFERQMEPEQEIERRDHVSVLRYQVQEIAQDIRKQLRAKEGEPVEGEQIEDRTEDEIEALANELDTLLTQVGAQSGVGTWTRHADRGGHPGDADRSTADLAVSPGGAAVPVFTGRGDYGPPGDRLLDTARPATLAGDLAGVCARPIVRRWCAAVDRAAAAFRAASGGRRFSARGYERITESWPYGDASQQAIAEQLPAPEKLYQAIAGERGSGLMVAVFGVATSFVSLLGQLFIALILSMYWSADRLRFERLWLSLLPAERRSRAREIWRSIENGVGAYVRSQAVQSLVAFVLLGGVYSLMGLSYPVLFALAGSLLLLVPWLGAVLAVVLPALSGLESDPWLGFAAGFFTLVVLLAMEFVVEPRFFDRSRYSSLLIVLTMVILAEAFGLVGIILAPVLAIALQILATSLATIQPVRENVNPAGELAALQTRLEQLRATLAEQSEPPAPEVVSLTERLEKALAEAGQYFEQVEPGQAVLGLPVNDAHPVGAEEVQ